MKLTIPLLLVLLCSCKSTKTATDLQVESKLNSNTHIESNSILIDTTTTNYFEHLLQNVRIEVEQTIIEYDKESGKPTKETKTKGTIVQNSDKASAKKEDKGVTNDNQSNVDKSKQQKEKVEAKTKEESEGGQKDFGKWLGIVIGFGIVIFIVYLLKKLRVI